MTRDTPTAREGKVVLEIAREAVRGLITAKGEANPGADHTLFDAPQ
jgi:hypothetical protein